MLCCSTLAGSWYKICDIPSQWPFTLSFFCIEKPPGTWEYTHVHSWGSHTLVAHPKHHNIWNSYEFCLVFNLSVSSPLYKNIHLGLVEKYHNKEWGTVNLHLCSYSFHMHERGLQKRRVRKLCMAFNIICTKMDMVISFSHEFFEISYALTRPYARHWVSIRTK